MSRMDRIPRWLAARKSHIAMGMAVVAVLGAVAAYRAAIAEQETSRLERKLDQGRMLEVIYRLELLDQYAQFAEYQKKIQTHEEKAKGLERSADELRSSDAGTALMDHLQAQEEFALARALRPFRDITWRQDFAQREWERLGIDFTVSNELAQVGFETRTSATMWSGFENEIREGQDSVVRLAGSVVLFVLALVAFTFANLWSGGKLRWSRAGVGMTAAALLIALWGDWEALKSFAKFGLLIVTLWILTRRLCRSERIQEWFNLKDDEEGEPLHPGVFGQLDFPAEHVHVAEADKRLSRWAVILLALTALFSAIDGYVYSIAARKTIRADGEAMAVQIEQAKTRPQRRAQAYKQLSDLATAEECWVRSAAIRQLDLLSGVIPPAVKARAREKADQLPDACSAVAKAPAADERGADFIRQAIYGPLTENLQTDLAKWDGMNDMALRVRSRATVFLRALTLFAIALYLFGHSLSMGRTREAFILFFWGAALTSAGALRSGMVWFQTPLPEEIEIEKAAQHYGHGRALLDLSHRPEDYSRALKDFENAVLSRSAFGFANYYRVQASDLMTSPQNEGYISLTSKEELAKNASLQDVAINALQNQKFGTKSFLDVLRGNDGWARILSGVVNGDRRSLKSGIATTQDLLESWRGNRCLLECNLGMAQLANGDQTEGLRTYKQAIQDLAAIQDEHTRKDLAAGAITDLDILRTYCAVRLNSQSYCAQLNREIAALKGRFVVAAWPADQKKPAAQTMDGLSELHLFVSPAGLGIEGLKAQPSNAVVLWYACDTDNCDVPPKDSRWGVWWVLPNLSGRMTNNDWTAFERGSFAWYIPASADPASNDQIQYNCLPGSVTRQQFRYRAELYLNGALAKELTSSRAPQFEPAISNRLNLAACHPADWSAEAAEKGVDPDWIKSYAEENRGEDNARLLLAAVYWPKRELDSGALLEKIAAATGIAFPARGRVSPLPEACASLPQLAGETWESRESDDLRVLSKSWIGADGMAYSASVLRRWLGQSPEKVDAEDCGILASATNLYQPSTK